MIHDNPFTRLEPNVQLPKFDCGDEDLNEFFHKDAIKWQEQLMAVTYYLDFGDDAVLYFSLSNDKISASTLPKSFYRKIKRKFPHQKHRNDYPAVKIGRFAVNKNFRCQPEHWGTMSMNFIKEWMVSDNKTGCCFITVDAYPNAVPFYIKNGFKFLGGEEEQRYQNYLSYQDSETTFALYFHLKNIIPPSSIK